LQKNNNKYKHKHKHKKKTTDVLANFYNNNIVICIVQISINRKTNNVCSGQNILGINIRIITLQ